MFRWSDRGVGRSDSSAAIQRQSRHWVGCWRAREWAREGAARITPDATVQVSVSLVSFIVHRLTHGRRGAGRRRDRIRCPQCPVLGLPHVPVKMGRVVVHLRCRARDVSVDNELLELEEKSNQGSAKPQSAKQRDQAKMLSEGTSDFDHSEQVA